MKHAFCNFSEYHPFTTVCVATAAFYLGLSASPAQTGDYLYSATEQTIILAPGLYDITVYGAQGGAYTFSGGSGSSGGLGAEMDAEFNFTTATALTLLVGGAGGAEDFPVPNSIGGGGGGGSFVVSGNTPLIVAGGGGGGGGFGDAGNIGSISSNGGNGDGAGGGSGGAGGISGSGGAYGNSDLEGDPGAGGGGGGFYVSGGGGSGGGGSYLSGGNGGRLLGGYGGGGGGGNFPGAGPSGGGGGGGYSGGGGGGYGPGGGGGSYIDSSAIEIFTGVSGIASSDGSPNGEIIITAVPEPGTLALAGLGGLSLMLFRRRCK